MPTYDLSQPYRVSVTLFGRELNHDYSRLLADNHDLDFGSVILLDMLQKGQHVTKSQAKLLHGQGLVEGRYPRIHISSGAASVVGEHEAYLRNKGLDNSICKQLIVQLLNMQPSTRSEILSAVEHALPADLTNEQKLKRLSYLLQSLRKGGVIEKEGSTANSVWHIRKE
jgi:ATP-dependent DNA helicase RecG